MYLLLNKNNVIVYMTSEVVYKSDGIHVGNNVIFSDKTLKTIPILDSIIPDNITIQKYCYTREKGFYENSSYVNEPNEEMKQKIEYILNKLDPNVDENALTLDEFKSLYIYKMGQECNTKIYAGTDVIFSDGSVEHFSLTLEDQKNIDKLVFKITNNGLTQIPYHSDTNICKLYSVEQFNLINLTVDNFIFYQTTYCNHINIWIRRCKSKDEIRAIYYGTRLPDDLQANLDYLVRITSDQIFN